MFTISRMTPSNIESSIFTQQRFEVGRVLRVTVKKKKEKNEERRWIHRWPGFLGSWKVFSSAGECKHCCLLESSLVPGSRASSLVISPLFPPVFLRPAAAILLLLFPLPLPPPNGFTPLKGPAAIGERKYFRSEELYTDVKRKDMYCKYCN